jgi:DNA polymerase III subunit epsilon
VSIRAKYWLTLLLALALFAVVAAATFMVFRADLSLEEQDALTRLLEGRAVLLIMLAIGFFLPLAAFVHYFFRRYPAALNRVGEELRIIRTINRDHRIEPIGAPEVKRVATEINRFVDIHSATLGDAEARLSEANRQVAEEKEQLVALMSELTLSVIVCNSAGAILLYNNRARELFGKVHVGTRAGGFVGLGRSIFSVIERSLITHALEQIEHRRSEGQTNLVTSFVMGAEGGKLLRVQLAPVLNEIEGSVLRRVETNRTAGIEQEQGVRGFVLTFEDITKTIEEGRRRDVLLQSLIDASRASLANLRAAVETVLGLPDMDPARLAWFINTISEEAAGLSARLNQTMHDYADSLKAQWPLEEMLGCDLITAAKRRVVTQLEIGAESEDVDGELWIKVDTYSFLQAIGYLTSRLKDEFSIGEVHFRLARAGRLAHLDLSWSGASISAEMLHAWESEPLKLAGEASPLTLKDVAERHGGQIQYQIDKLTDHPYFRLLVPAADLGEMVRQAPARAESRRPYYDFDLFNRPGPHPELDERDLSELSYTVFDTETTGLNPSQGDEIIEIAAVRIVNGRLLKHETFDQLVDPKRYVRRESVEIHGISPEMLKGQPIIGQVLPAFHRFAEDTVLVAHNAAFDMRFLQMKEERTGVKFIQPVLDTLLLSAVAHPGFEAGEHTLEVMAARFGIEFVGRHTALGDALVTGEVFLKLIPLLAERGIHTLKEARVASQKTLYARLDY